MWLWAHDASRIVSANGPLEITSWSVELSVDLDALCDPNRFHFSCTELWPRSPLRLTTDWCRGGAENTCRLQRARRGGAQKSDSLHPPQPPAAARSPVKAARRHHGGTGEASSPKRAHTQ